MTDDVRALIAEARDAEGEADLYAQWPAEDVKALIGQLRAALEASVQAPAPELLACPHWNGGGITMRERCTACEAVQAPAVTEGENE